MFDFGKWTSAFNSLLLGTGMPDWAAVLIECVIIAVLVLATYTVLALFYILYERKLCAWFQCRLGPMRVGNGVFFRYSPICSRFLSKSSSVLKAQTAFYSSWLLTL